MTHFSHKNNHQTNIAATLFNVFRDGIIPEITPPAGLSTPDDDLLDLSPHQYIHSRP
jgi:hypothetical protein